MKNTDTRVQITKKMLSDAMLTLLKEKPIGSITVKEIVDTAGINRGTFYLHYDTPLSLLKDMENRFVQENLKLFESFMEDGYDRSYLANLFKGVWDNRDMLCAFLGPNGDPSFVSSLRELARKRTVDEWNTEFPQYSREHLDFLFDFVFPGFTSLLISWLQDNRGVDSEEFTRRMERLGHYALLSVEEFH